MFGSQRSRVANKHGQTLRLNHLPAETTPNPFLVNRRVWPFQMSVETSNTREASVRGPWSDLGDQFQVYFADFVSNRVVFWYQSPPTLHSYLPLL